MVSKVGFVFLVWCLFPTLRPAEQHFFVGTQGTQGKTMKAVLKAKAKSCQVNNPHYLYWLRVWASRYCMVCYTKSLEPARDAWENKKKGVTSDCLQLSAQSDNQTMLLLESGENHRAEHKQTQPRNSILKENQSLPPSGPFLMSLTDCKSAQNTFRAA